MAEVEPGVDDGHGLPRAGRRQAVHSDRREPPFGAFPCSPPLRRRTARAPGPERRCGSRARAPAPAARVRDRAAQPPDREVARDQAGACRFAASRDRPPAAPVELDQGVRRAFDRADARRRRRSSQRVRARCGRGRSQSEQAGPDDESTSTHLREAYVAERQAVCGSGRAPLRAQRLEVALEGPLVAEARRDLRPRAVRSPTPAPRGRSRSRVRTGRAPRDPLVLGQHRLELERLNRRADDRDIFGCHAGEDRLVDRRAFELGDDRLEALTEGGCPARSNSSASRTTTRRWARAIA